MWLGDLARKQACGGARQDHSSNQIIIDIGVVVVRGGDGSSMEEHLPYNSDELQIGDTTSGSPSLGLDAQSLVELHNGHSAAIMGGGRSFEQVEKAISGALLQRIRMVDTGKEISGQEGNGNKIDGKPPNAEACSNSCSGQEMRCVDMLQGRCGGNIEVHDDMETGVEALKGFVKEDRMEYGRSCNNES